MPASARHASGASQTSLLFMFLAILVCGVSAGLSWELMHVFGRSASRTQIFFPRPFLLSTLLLAAGSVMLHLALRAVQQEQQRLFRKRLIWSLACAALFMGTQIYGLWCLFPEVRSSEDAETGVTAFVFALTTLHAAHFFVASLFVCFVTARAFIMRYDHEYYWGVKVCAWFWHALGMIWIAILAVFTMVIR